MRVLVVDDDSGLRLSVSASLHATGKFQVEEAADGEEAVQLVSAKKFDIVILDVNMPKMTGLEALKVIKEHDPSIIVIILTAHANIEDAVRAVKEGAYNYISKPVRSEELLALIDKAMMAQAMIASAAASSPTLLEDGRKFIGNTEQMQKVFNIIHRLSKVDTAVMIRGESGTGKELVARAIHFNSARKNEKFVAINCSAIPENLFESELFGHEKGAFTSADQRKIGKFQFAEGGTLFLDELGDMPLHMQVKLLRVLQEKKFTPVGSNRELDSNVRIIAATNRPLEEMISKGTFREDLFYRLNVIPIFLPPLRARKQDIETLANNFITKFNNEHGKKIIGLSMEALNVLKKYEWPGNIRELENIIEHSFVLEEDNRIHLSSLPEKILNSVGVSMNSAWSAKGDGDSEDGSDEIVGSREMGVEIITGDGALDFNRHKELFEREFIIKALKSFKGRINQTALHANIPKKTLLRKIEKYGLNPKDYIQT